MSNKLYIYKFTNFTGWVFVVLGTLGVAFLLPVTYMVISGQVQSGEPYYVDGLAPTTVEAIIALGTYFAIFILGVIMRVFSKRGAAHNKKLQPTADASVE